MTRRATASGSLGALPLLLLLAGLPWPAAATTYMPVSDDHLVDRAAVIGVFEVAASDLAPTAQLTTEYHLRVESLVKGRLPGATALLRVAGGEARTGEGLRFYGLPSFRPGESVLLFLVPRRDGTWGIAHTLLGAFRTVERPGGALFVRPHLFEARGVDRSGRPVADDGATARDRALFLAWIADRVAGRSPRPDYFVPVDAEVLAPRFTLFRRNGVPLRWFAFDRGVTAVWRADQNGAAGFADGGAAAMQAGLAAWPAVTQTNIRLAWGGMAPRDQGFEDPDGQNMVLFDDPYDSIDEDFDCFEGGVLAVGGPWFLSRTSRYRNQDWHEIVEGQVILNENLSCYFRGSTVRLAEVIGHELGHTLGFGHSCGDDDGPSCAANAAWDDALMRAFVHDDGRGARLGSDDIAAARGSYGTGGSNTPRAPNQLTAQLQLDDVVLSWNDRSNNEQGFRIYRRSGGGAFSPIGETAASQTSFVDADVAPGTHTYEVRAFNAAGEGAASNRVTVVTEVVEPGIIRFADDAFYGSEATGEAVVTLERLNGASGALSVRLRTVDLSAEAPLDYGARDVIVTWAAGDDTPKVITVAVVDDFTVEDTELVDLLLESVLENGQLGFLVGRATATIADNDGSPGCAASDRRLCLLGGRFRVEVEWHNFRNGMRGVGHALPGSDQSGYFWFFDEQNVELIVKALDGRPLTGAHWLFYGGLSDVEYWVVVTDTATGTQKLYRNAPGNICGIGDTGAFPQAGGVSASAEHDRARGLRAMGGLGGATEAVAPQLTPAGFAAAASGGAWLANVPSATALSPRVDCVAGPHALCLLGDRFRVEVAWHNHRNGATGTGTATQFSDQTGFFWFFDAANIELVVKALDGQSVNGSFWFFYGALSDVEYTITVTDTATGAVHFYNNAGGNICGVGDINAFP